MAPGSSAVGVPVGCSISPIAQTTNRSHPGSPAQKNPLSTMGRGPARLPGTTATRIVGNTTASRWQRRPACFSASQPTSEISHGASSAGTSFGSLKRSDTTCQSSLSRFEGCPYTRYETSCRAVEAPSPEPISRTHLPNPSPEPISRKRDHHGPATARNNLHFERGGRRPSRSGCDRNRRGYSARPIALKPAVLTKVPPWLRGQTLDF
jgi:hypothetical protein